MSRKTENTSFVCVHCGRQVPLATNGSYRDHCPFCLYSLHVDIVPGDRANPCGGLMKPIRLIWNSRKGYQIRYRCEKCGREHVNKVAQDTDMPDDWDQVIKLLRNKEF